MMLSDVGKAFGRGAIKPFDQQRGTWVDWPILTVTGFFLYRKTWDDPSDDKGIVDVITSDIPSAIAEFVGIAILMFFVKRAAVGQRVEAMF